MTSWSDVIANSALVIIDDIRLTEQLAANPAQFFRKMSFYCSLAVPLMNRPPDLLQYLQKSMVEPQYGAVEWISTQESLETQSVVQTGMAGFELMSCAMRKVDGTGNVMLLPYTEAVYNKEDGTVTFPIQSEVGVDYEMDFYTDGQFPDLSATLKRLLGLAIAVVWDERFSRNWLNMQPKIKDSSFDTVNEANYMEKVTNRMVTNRAAFNDELRKYEQDIAYSGAVPASQRPANFL